MDEREGESSKEDTAIDTEEVTLCDEEHQRLIGLVSEVKI